MLFLAVVLACSSGKEAPTEPVAKLVPDALVARSWQVEISAPGKLDAVLATGPWQAVFERNFAEATPGFGASGPTAARMHAEMASIYRQALLAQSNAIVETYKADQRREGDPAEVDYLLGVSYLVRGEKDLATPLFGRSAKSSSAKLAAADKAWAARAGGDWFTLSTDPALFPMPAVAPGTVPSLPEAAHYEVPETIDDLPVQLSDPTALLQAAIWHEQAAVAAGGAELAGALIAPWRLAPEPHNATVPADMPVETLFLSVWSTEGDLALAAALAAGQPALEALAAHQSDSPYAVALNPCVKDGVMDVECVLDVPVPLGNQFEAAMAAALGQEVADQRIFADFVRAGVLRVASSLADSLGDTRMGGVLRLNARDRSVGPAADPNFLLSMAAWDARQRNAQRALQLLHGYADRLPGLQAARVSLDALQLRVSRDAGPALPMH